MAYVSAEAHTSRHTLVRKVVRYRTLGTKTCVLGVQSLQQESCLADDDCQITDLGSGAACGIVEVWSLGISGICSAYPACARMTLPWCFRLSVHRAYRLERDLHLSTRSMSFDPWARDVRACWLVCGSTGYQYAVLSLAPPCTRDHLEPFISFTTWPFMSTPHGRSIRSSTSLRRPYLKNRT